MTAPLLAGLSRAFVPEGRRIVALDDVSLSPVPGGDALTPVRPRPGGGGTMAAPLIVARGLKKTFVSAGRRVVALDVSLSPAPGGEALMPVRPRPGGGRTMAVPLIVAAGLSRTLPARRRLAGLDDVSLAPGDAFRFSPPPAGVRPGEAGS